MDMPLNTNGKVFTSWKYDESTWFITMMNNSQYIYLLEGENSALLIDTGYGVGDLRGYVETLTNKPVSVAITHGHQDHSSGAAEWEKVYMHMNAPKDMDGVDDSKLPHPDYERVFVGDGFVFDLGGRNVDVIEISSHSNGSLAFLDSSHRALYCGDEIESMQVIILGVGDANYNYEANIRAQKKNMLKLKERGNEYDYLFPSHDGSPISKSYIDDFIALDDHILAGDAIIDEKLNNQFFDNSPFGNGLCRVRWNNASLFSMRTDVEKLIK